MKRITLCYMLLSLFVSCQQQQELNNEETKTNILSTEKAIPREQLKEETLQELTDCRKEIIRKLKLEFEYGALHYLGDHKVFEKELKDFVQSIAVNTLLVSDGLSFSKSYFLHRNWNLEYIKEDECKDEIFLRYDEETKSFTIQINNCSLVKEDGEVIHASEQSTMFEFNIGKKCSFKFHKVTGAG